MTPSKFYCVTVTAPTNIACIKYWGKKDPVPNTPLNDSASVTLHQDDLKTVTSCACSPDFSDHRLWLNGEEVDVTDLTGRFHKVVTGVCRVLDTDAGGWKFHVSSRNTFPTAAGVASSAAGYAALTYGLACLVLTARAGGTATAPGDELAARLSGVARAGSGSASRSMFGGFVAWRAGVRPDGADSLADPIAPHGHWPDLRALLLIVSDEKKGTSSTAGMGTSVATSTLLQYRVSDVVPARMVAIEEAYRNKDFPSFGKITMMDSNSFHACCADTYPPIFYMNDTSRQIVRMVHAYNDYVGEIAAAYTYDAGPNAVVYTTEGHVVPLLAALLPHFPSCRDDYVSDAGVWEGAKQHHVDPALEKAMAGAAGGPGGEGCTGLVKKIYHTRAGPGPILQPEGGECMIDAETGCNNYSKP